MLYVWKYVLRQKKLLLLTIFGAIFFVLVNLGLPTILAFIINDVIINQDTEFFYFLILVMAVIIVLGLLGNILLSLKKEKILLNNIFLGILENVTDCIHLKSHVMNGNMMDVLMTVRVN